MGLSDVVRKINRWLSGAAPAAAAANAPAGQAPGVNPVGAKLAMDELVVEEKDETLADEAES